MSKRSEIEHLWLTLEKTADSYDVSAKEALQSLQRLAAAEPDVRRWVTDQYLQEGPMGREWAKEVLLSVAATSHVQKFAQSLLASEDTAQRRDAYELLQAGSPSHPESIAVIAAAFIKERDPDLLAVAIGALQWTRARLDPLTVERLQSFTAHTDPAVRIASIQALTVSSAPEASEPILAQALLDADAEVRLAAAEAAGAAHFDLPGAKTTLLELAADNNAPFSTRSSALAALQLFQLSTDEQASVNRIDVMLTESD